MKDKRKLEQCLFMEDIKRKKNENEIPSDPFVLEKIISQLPSLCGVVQYLQKKDCRFEGEKGSKIFTEYVRFLSLKILEQDYEGRILSPSPLVDTCWHTHILHTRSYLEFCHFAGQVYHHRPEGEFEDARWTRYKTTIARYKHHFSTTELDKSIWYDINEPSTKREPSDTLLQLTFVMLDGKKVVKNYNPNTTIQKIKEDFAEKTLEVDHFRLIHRGRMLFPQDIDAKTYYTLADFDVMSGETIYFGLRLRGC